MISFQQRRLEPESGTHVKVQNGAAKDSAPCRRSGAAESCPLPGTPTMSQEPLQSPETKALPIVYLSEPFNQEPLRSTPETPAPVESRPYGSATPVRNPAMEAIGAKRWVQNCFGIFLRFGFCGDSCLLRFSLHFLLVFLYFPLFSIGFLCLFSFFVFSHWFSLFLHWFSHIFLTFFVFIVFPCFCIGFLTCFSHVLCFSFVRLVFLLACMFLTFSFCLMGFPCYPLCICPSSF